MVTRVKFLWGAASNTRHIIPRRAPRRRRILTNTNRRSLRLSPFFLHGGSCATSFSPEDETRSPLPLARLVRARFIARRLPSARVSLRVVTYQARSRDRRTLARFWASVRLDARDLCTRGTFNEVPFRSLTSK